MEDKTTGTETGTETKARTGLTPSADAFKKAVEKLERISAENAGNYYEAVIKPQNLELALGDKLHP